ncbi:MAG: folate-binding protein [Chloroflexi bacterium]|nr:MAG: folate-binding protein [Chloroflexota bacterium]
MTTNQNQIDMKYYEAAHNSAVFVNRSNLGLLKFTGETRLDLIHRMSTQAVNQLKSGEGAATILTTDIGRMIDRLILYVASTAVYAITGEDNADNIARYLMGYVFFNDDFHIENLTPETAVFGVYGPQAQSLLHQAGFPETDLPLHHWRETQLDNIPVWLHRTDPVAGDGYFIMCAHTHQEKIRQQLQHTGLVEIDEPAFEYLRIESGLPRFGREITSDYIPLEANLWADVSFHKGCYIGQEVIARMESRGRIAKKLVQLRPSGPVTTGDTILANGKTAGIITSAATGPAGWVALGYIKTAVLNTPNTTLTANQTPLTLHQPTPQPKN